MVETGSNFTRARDDVDGVKVYILSIVQIAMRLEKKLDVPKTDDFLVHSMFSIHHL